MLALIAGQGRLPTLVAEAFDGPHTIAALDGFAPDKLTSDHVFRIEKLGSFLAEMTQAGVTEVCFAGSIQRPPLDPSLVDSATMPLVPRMMQALQQGDDAALRTVIAFFEEAGLTVRAAHDLVPGLLPEKGVLTQTQPGLQHKSDAARAQAIVAAMGAEDIGQACVVQNGQALAVECSFGTEWMLASLVHRPKGTGGVLFKAPKPTQDRRIDLPAIGPDTVEQSKKAGLEGIIVEAGGVMVLDRQATIEAADRHSMFLWVHSS